MFTVSMGLLGFGLPILLTAGLLAGTLFRRRPAVGGEGVGPGAQAAAPLDRFAWLGGPVVCIAFAVAFWQLSPDKPIWPPGVGNVFYWIFYFTLALGILMLLDGLLAPPAWLRAVVLLLLWRLAARAILSPLVPDTISTSAAEAWIDVAALTALLWAVCLETVAQRHPSVGAPLVAGILGVGSAVTLVSWSIIRSAMMAGSLATLCLVLLAYAIWRPSAAIHRATVAVALLLQLLLLHGYFYAPGTFGPAWQIRNAILMLAPLALLIGELSFLCRLRPSRRFLIGLAALVIVTATTAALNLRAYLVEQAANAQQGDE